MHFFIVTAITALLSAFVSGWMIWDWRDSKCDAAAMHVEIARERLKSEALKDQIEKLRQARDDETKRANEVQIKFSELLKENISYETQIEKLGGQPAACRLDRSDVTHDCRLRRDPACAGSRPPR